MIVEYSYYDTVANDTEIKDNLLKSIKYPINTISVLPPYLKLAKSVLPEHIYLSCPIDYPLGILDTTNRYHITEFAIKNGAKIVEMVCPVQLLCNRKYEKFRDDIKNITGLCADNGVEIRYILEYRLYSYDLLYKIAQILIGHNIFTAYPSTGYLLDDINDNVLACALINKKVPNLNIICNGNIWNENQIKMIQKADLYGLRVNSLNGLDLVTKNILKS